jgi:hypothetical protein
MTETTSFVSCPNTPLELNVKAKQQLCNGYCSAQHYATAPLCDTFDVSNATLCGAAARAYDDDAGYSAPPGNLASPRCSGFPEPAVDAGPPSPVDAGVADAGLSQGDDAGDPSENAGGDDAGDEDEDEEEQDGGEDADEVDEDGDADDAGALKKRKKRGCDCMLAEHHGGTSAPLLALAFGLTFIWRRSYRTARAGRENARRGISARQAKPTRGV